jgi:hypothetical protein
LIFIISALIECCGNKNKCIYKQRPEEKLGIYFDEMDEKFNIFHIPRKFVLPVQ